MALPRPPALVVDTAALLQLDLRLDRLADKLYSVPEVLAEVRSRQARDRLAAMPYDIELREPTDPAVRFVNEFAKKTGDFAVLSAVDLRVVALTYTLEVELTKGAAHLRTEPRPPQTVVGSGGVPLDAAAAAARLPEGFYHPDDSANEATDGAAGSGPAAAAVSGSDAAAGSGLDAAAGSGPNTAAEAAGAPGTAPNGEGAHAHPHDAPVDVTAALNDAHDDDHEDDGDGDDDDDDDEGWITPSQRADGAHAHQHEAQMDVTANGGDVADDDEGWITPSNVAAMRAKNRAAAAGTPAETPAPGVVACITSDFAMQNVLLQIGLRVLGVDGKLIRQMRTYVLRCHACFKSTKDMTKKFCPTCGNATLIRTSVSVDADGTLRYHLKHNFQYRLRGTKYPLPTPQGGREAANIVLTEDQKEFTQRRARTRKERRAENAFDPDASVGFSAARQTAQGPPVGFGRRNPNETKGRTGRKKS